MADPDPYDGHFRHPWRGFFVLFVFPVVVLLGYGAVLFGLVPTGGKQVDAVATVASCRPDRISFGLSYVCSAPVVIERWSVGTVTRHDAVLRSRHPVVGQVPAEVRCQRSSGPDHERSCDTYALNYGGTPWWALPGAFAILALIYGGYFGLGHLQRSRRARRA